MQISRVSINWFGGEEEAAASFGAQTADRIYFDRTYLKKFRAFIMSEFNYSIIVAKRIHDNYIFAISIEN